MTKSDSQNVGHNNNNKIQIITDDPAEEDALYFQSYSENLANIIREAKPKFPIGIFGKWGTGKTTLMKMIKGELEKDKDKDKILTVWFDAWRYEKEKYLAVIPFLRQIRIALEKGLKE
jgi:predicted KAP-like P-loop ATPase